MFRSTIIVDPKSEIKGKQDFSTYIVKPTLIDRSELIRIKDIQLMLTWSTKTAFSGSHKNIVIEEMHKSSDAVPHALLKLLEEPPHDTQITLTIDRAESALNTIRSRCAIVHIQNVDSDMLNHLGLYRSEASPSNTSTTWLEFTSLSPTDQLNWTASFIKSKKDAQVQLSAWQCEVALLLGQGNTPANNAVSIKQLALLEDANLALRQNVLPRLVLHNLHIQLHALQ